MSDRRQYLQDKAEQCIAEMEQSIASSHYKQLKLEAERLAAHRDAQHLTETQPKGAT